MSAPRTTERPGREPLQAKAVVKAAARGLAFVAALPAILSFWIRKGVFGRDRALQGSTQALALLPGLPGQYIRVAFLRCALDQCDKTAVVEFGTIFSRAGTRIGEHVYIGAGCRLGLVHIERDALMAGGVKVPSGARTHRIDDLGIPIREQPRGETLVRIGAGSWIGEGAVIMADVGDDAVVGAGAVVTRVVPARAVAAGVPARVLRRRDAHPARAV